MYLYHIVSGIKFCVGALIIFFDFNYIYVQEDPAIALGLGFLGLFIALWGASYFLFLGIQNIVRRVSRDRIYKDSYKLSLLFGIYAMINVLFFFLGTWSKILGLVLLIIFLLLQVALFSDKRVSHN